MGSDVTTRDRVWAASIKLACEQHRFLTRDVHVAMDDPPSHKTIQRTLRGMTALDALYHNRGSRWYRAGPLLQ